MKGSKIWGVGKHHLYVNKEPTWVYVSKEALKKDYNILKANLPIPIGIDHLDKKTIQENKILQKMDLLNVGTIEDVELTDEGIKILEAKITNPLIQELYNQEKLPSWSIVSKVALKECKSGKVDYIEDYSIINRVDFVEKGACTTCNVEYEKNLMNAKSVIGDIMAEEENNQNNENGQEDKSQENEEPNLNDIVKSITDFKEEVTGKLDNIDQRITAIEENQVEAKEPEEDESSDDDNNPELEAMKAEIAEMKAQAAKKEATSLVNGYINEGKVLPKQVEKHVSLALAEPKAYKDMMAEAPEIVPLNERLSNAEGSNPDDEGSDEEDPVDDLVKMYDDKED